MKKRTLSLLLALLMLLSMVPVNVIAEGTEDYSANVTGTAVFNPAWNTVSDEETVYGVAYVTNDPTQGLNMSTDYTMSLEGVMDQTFYINDYYSNGTGYWYELAPLEGETLPGKLSTMPWVYQNDIPSGSYPDYLIVTPPVVDPTDPTDPVEPTDPTEPEDSCACCESCTGAEGCQCLCGGCDFCQPEEEPELPVLTHPTGVEVTAESFPEGVTLTVQDANVASQLNKYRIPESKQVFGLDISLLNADSSIYQPGGALVKVPVSAPVGTKIGIIHDHNGNISFMGVTEVLADGTVEFYTDSFSTFAGFTVDFHYNGVDFSIEGMSEILLSDLFTAMGIEEDAYAAKSVVFSDNTLVGVERQDDGNWLLTSLEAFTTNETLIITFNDDRTIVIDVTDAWNPCEDLFGKTVSTVNKGGSVTNTATFYLYYSSGPNSGRTGEEKEEKIYVRATGNTTIGFKQQDDYWHYVSASNASVTNDALRSVSATGESFSSNDTIYIDRISTSIIDNEIIKVRQQDYAATTYESRTVVVKVNGVAQYSVKTNFPTAAGANASTQIVVSDVASNYYYSDSYTYSGNVYTIELLTKHTIIWNNWDNTTLETDDNVVYGATPSYNGTTPTKATAEGYSYSFSGWSPSVTKVTENTTYTAWFSPSPISYSVSFNGNGATDGSMSNQSFTFGTAQNLTANGYTRAYTVTYDAKGGTVNTTEANTTATATFNGWEDRGAIAYKGVNYSYEEVDIPFYVNPNRYPDPENHSDADLYRVLGYNKYALIEHYVNYVKSGTENRPYKDKVPGLWPNQALVSNMTTEKDYTVPLYANWTLGSVTLPNPKKTGYAFKGWYTDAACSDGNEVKGTTYTPTSNVTLYAKWEANTYKVTLDARNNAGESDGTTAYWYMYNTTKDVNGETVYYWTDAACTQPLSGYTITKPVKKGHTFGGYYKELADGDVKYYVDANGMCINNLYAAVAGNSTLYAKWNAKTFTVNYHSNGGSGSMDSHTVVYGNTIQIKDNAFTAPRGKRFAGWAVSSTGTAGEHGWSRADKTGWSGTWSYDNGEYGIANDTLNLYAVWEDDDRTVTWKNWNGDELEKDTVTYNGTATYNGTTPTRESADGYSYSFTGWDKGTNGTVSNVTTDTTVTAQYSKTPISYTASFDYNSGDEGVATKNFTVESALTLPKLTKTGYTGKWIVTKVEGNWVNGAEFASEGSVAAGKYGNVTFTAQWQRIGYVVTYDANGGTNAPEAQVKQPNVSLSLTLDEPIRDGYHFMGWGMEANTTYVTYKGDDENRNTYSEDKDITLYAIWGHKLKVNIITNIDGTTIEDGQIVYQYEEDGVIRSESWGNGTEAVWHPATLVDRTLTFSSRNDLSIKAVRVNVNGTEIDNQSLDNYVYQYAYTYLFTDELSADTVIDVYFDAYRPVLTTSMTNGVVQVGGADLPGIIRCNPGDHKNVDVVFVPTSGYKITSVTVNGVKDNNPSLNARGRYIYNTGSDGLTENVTIHATAEIDTYTITYDLKGGEWPSGAVPPGTYQITYTLNITNPTRTGWKFTGWEVSGATATENENWDETYTGIQNLTGRYGSVKLEAKWVEQYRYVLKFDANGGENAPAQIIQDWTDYTEHTFTWTQIPTRDGYTFIGWAEAATSEINAAGSSYNTYTVPGKKTETVEKTLYAIWQRQTGDLKLTFNGGETAPAIVTVSGQGKTITLVLTKAETVIKGLPTGTYTVTAESGSAQKAITSVSDNAPLVENGLTTVVDIQIGSRGLSWFTAFFWVKNECTDN